MSAFRLLATGQSLSWLGSGFQTVALAVAIVLAGGGAGDLGLVMASSFGAILVCTLFGGVWADRVQPQRVMVLSDAVRCLTAAGMAVMFAAGSYHLPLLCGLAALAGGAGAGGGWVLRAGRGALSAGRGGAERRPAAARAGAPPGSPGRGPGAGVGGRRRARCPPPPGLHFHLSYVFRGRTPCCPDPAPC